MVLAACCACAFAEDEHTMAFVEQNRVNYKPVVAGNPPGFEVDTWLQKMAVVVDDENYFWREDPEGPKYSFECTGGPATQAHIDGEGVLRLDTIHDDTCKVTFTLTATWAGVTAETHMYVEFFSCTQPKTIGFKDEYTLKPGEKIRLESNFDDGSWPYRDYRGLYADDVSDYGIIDVWSEAFPGNNTGACMYIQALRAGEATVTATANQNGLNWTKTIKIHVTEPSAQEQVTLKKLKSVKLKALSAKKLQVSWKKLSKKEQKQIQKIQIQYSTDKNFKTGVKTRWAKKTKASYTIKGLKKNTKYWVRIRAYSKSGKFTYVSKWITKNKKTKKK